MKKFPKMLRLGYLFFAVMLLSATSLAQSTHHRRRVVNQPNEQSTADLEAQPNTSQYPRDQRPLLNPGPPTADQESQPQTIQTPFYQQPTQQQSPPAIRPGVVTGSPVMNQPPGTPVNMPNQPVNPGSTGHVLIGPPASLPPTPEKMAPAPAKIVYQNGLLSIESVNALFSDILNGVHKKTGIQFEGVQATNDRVAGKFGPAPPDEVLVSLLRGSRFDYVIIGAPDNPGLIQRVILTPNATAGAAPASPVPQPQPAETGDDEENGEEPQGEPQEQVQYPQPVRPQPAGNGARTQEQMVEELQLIQKQQQQQQQNQQQNPNSQKPPGPPPAPSRRPINPQ